MFWNSEMIRLHCGHKKIITPFDDNRIKHCAYELSIGNSLYTSDSQKKQYLGTEEILLIQPGQFALLETKEEINIPCDILGFISIKAGIKFRGLINVSGFHVDPGYRGRLVFSVYNAGSQVITLEEGKPAFLLWFAQLTDSTKDKYDGNSNKGITTYMIDRIRGEVASPAALNERLSTLEKNVRIGKWLGGLVIGILCAFISGVTPYIIGLVK